MPDKRRAAGADLRGRLTTLGVFGARGHEHLTGSLVVPVFDSHAKVFELYGRKIRDDLRPGTPLHLYLPGPHRGVFNEPALAASEEIVLSRHPCTAYRIPQTRRPAATFTHNAMAMPADPFDVTFGP